MKTSEVHSRYKEICDSGKFICSESELNDFKLCGLIIELGNNTYILKDTKIKDITLIKDMNMDFDIDFNKLLNIDLKPYGTNKVYYMSKKTFDKYKENNLIITKEGHDYYRLYANELWLVQLL